MTMDYHYKIPFFFTNPFKIHFPDLKQVTIPFQYEIQSRDFSIHCKVATVQHVQIIKKTKLASLLFLILTSSHSAIVNFNLLISKQKPSVLEEQKTIFNCGDSRKPSQKDIK